MRTTLDLPEELLKQAKIAAVQRGWTLRELIAVGLKRELDQPGVPSVRPRLPVIHVPAGAPVLRMNGAELNRAASELDLQGDLRRTRRR